MNSTEHPGPLEVRLSDQLCPLQPAERLYALTPEDVEAVNADRRHRAWKATRRLDLCQCDHTEYCQHCHPLEFRPGGVWGGPNVEVDPHLPAQEQR